MRLWHYKLIPLLPRQQLLGQHRECCALRGKGWGKKHATVDYIFKYHPYNLYVYHRIVIDEMYKRGYKISNEWFDSNYRGKECPPHTFSQPEDFPNPYLEHNEEYLQECVENLEKKGVSL